MNPTDKIYIAGHKGLVGSALHRALLKQGFHNFVFRSSAELDLRNQTAVAQFFETEKPDYVFLAAAKVGGIGANSQYRADFIYDNLMIETNIIHQSFCNHVKKLLFLGSSCIYPRMAPQPLKEDYLLSGPLEDTNEPYAIAKIAGIKLCDAYRDQHGCNFISVMPTNLYGPNDNYDLQNSHVLPAMIRKFHEAKTQGKKDVLLWGSGSPLREFLHVDDLAQACVFLMQSYNEKGLVNIGTGLELTIKELAEMIQKTVGFQGQIVWDSSKPDGTPRKLLDVSKLHQAGWHHQIELADGLNQVYQAYCADAAHRGF